MFAFLQKSESSLKIQQIFIVLFLAYLLIGTMIVTFDLGKQPWCRALADVGYLIIPSINGTAKITSAPASAATVLSLAWLWGMVMYLPIAWLLVSTSFRAVNWQHWEGLSRIYRIGVCSCALSVTIVLAYLVPTQSAGMEGVIFDLLVASPHFVVLWGATLWAPVWFGLVMWTIGFVGLFRKFNHFKGE